MKNEERKSDEITRKDRQDFFVKYLAIISPLLLTAYIAYNQQEMAIDKASKEQVSANASAKRESQKPFLEKQVQLYFEAAKTTAEIAVDRIKGRQDSTKIDKFWQLYWGELALVEDKAVKDAMVDYGFCLEKPGADDCQKAFAMRYKGEHPDRKIPTNSDPLPFMALYVAHACRDSLKQSFDR